MSKQDSGEQMINQTNQIDSSVKQSCDPLPWLIHNLREKQAEHSPSKKATAPTEPAKDAS